MMELVSQSVSEAVADRAGACGVVLLLFIGRRGLEP